MAIGHQRRGREKKFLQEPDPVDTHNLDLPASRTVRNKIVNVNLF
jgi:hypothetical protein